MGKDFRRDTVEITGITDPGSYIAFSGLDYDYIVYDTSTFFDENDIIEELETYDDHTNHSFSHKWYYGKYPSLSLGSTTSSATSGTRVRIPHYRSDQPRLQPQVVLW